MKKLAVLLVALCLLAALPLAAEDKAEKIGLDIGLDFTSGDFLTMGDNGFYLEAAPSIGYTFGETGFSVTGTWTVPLVPTFSAGSFELDEDYTFDVADFSFTIENANNFYFGDTFSWDGCAELSVAWKILSLGFDFTYWDTFAIDSWLSVDWSKDIGPGSLGLGVCFNFPLYMTPDVGDIEPYVSYEFPAGPVSLKAEVDGTLSSVLYDTRAFALTATVGVSMSL